MKHTYCHKTHGPSYFNGSKLNAFLDGQNLLKDNVKYSVCNNMACKMNNQKIGLERMRSSTIIKTKLLPRTTNRKITSDECVRMVQQQLKTIIDMKDEHGNLYVTKYTPPEMSNLYGYYSTGRARGQPCSTRLVVIDKYSSQIGVNIVF